MRFPGPPYRRPPLGWGRSRYPTNYCEEKCDFVVIDEVCVYCDRYQEWDGVNPECEYEWDNRKQHLDLLDELWPPKIETYEPESDSDTDGVSDELDGGSMSEDEEDLEDLEKEKELQEERERELEEANKFIPDENDDSEEDEEEEEDDEEEEDEEDY